MGLAGLLDRGVSGVGLLMLVLGCEAPVGAVWVC